MSIISSSNISVINILKKFKNHKKKFLQIPGIILAFKKNANICWYLK